MPEGKLENYSQNAPKKNETWYTVSAVGGFLLVVLLIVIALLSSTSTEIRRYTEVIPQGYKLACWYDGPTTDNDKYRCLPVPEIKEK